MLLDLFHVGSWICFHAQRRKYYKQYRFPTTFSQGMWICGEGVAGVVGMVHVSLCRAVELQTYPTDMPSKNMCVHVRS